MSLAVIPGHAARSVVPRRDRRTERLFAEAVTMRALGDWHGAASRLLRCAKRTPRPEVWRELAMCCMAAGESDRALAIMEQTAEAAPDLPDLAWQLGQLYERAGRYEDALTSHRRALDVCAASGEMDAMAAALSGLASCLKRMGRPAEARKYAGHARAFAGETVRPHTRYVVADVLLDACDWDRGWEYYESRWQNPMLAAKAVQGYGLTLADLATRWPARWNGTDRVPLTIMAEQGLGDVLLFSRWLPVVHAITGEPVRFVCPEPLIPFFAAHEAEWLTLTSEPAPGESAAWAPLLSLPHLTGHGEPPSPWCPPSLAWQGGTDAVGVCWKGNAANLVDRDRSAPASFLPDVATRFPAVSLQQGEPTTFTDFADTARTVQSLRAVITVDTSIAHLAGTLGCPTVVIPETGEEWRWPSSTGERTPWFPRCTVVRRQDYRPESWPPAIQRAIEAIA